MALSELAEAIQQQANQQREKESELLANITALSNYKTAAAAADFYAAEKTCLFI